MKKIALILAAGKGTRLKSNNSKILTKVNNKTLIDHSIDKAKSLGFEANILINEKNKKKIYRKDCNIYYQKKPLGTGHAVKVFLRKKKKFKICMVMNCDTPFISKFDIKKVLTSANYSDLSLLTYKDNKNRSSGVIINNEIKEYSFLSNFEKKLGLCFSGLIIFKKKVSKEFFNIKKNKKKKEYLITDILKICSKKNYKVKIIKSKFPKFCIGVNTISDLKKVRRILKLKK